ncbi:MAG TPA: SAM-dependent methyltransferase [Flavisolibacter sp.]|nr:SAM-dependent methyltransferase [Flavisolibacter sp.]
MSALLYLIPTVLAEGQKNCLPAYILDAINDCSVIFAEEERTARRFLKSLSKEIVIDHYEWFNMKEDGEAVAAAFKQKINEGKKIGILSEAGCPGVADPGQFLAAIAQQMNCPIKPLVGPNSILLALMASGMNGQQFRFSGYLPIDASQRIKAIRDLESESRQKNCTEIFIETPYRNNQLLETLVKTCHPQTKICVAVDLTADTETIRTKTVKEWKSCMPELHKRPAIFLLYAGN